jgi:hypothetical protein
MMDLFLIFWAVMIFSSIIWYGFLVFYVGAKGAKEIKSMTEALSKPDRHDGSGNPPG